MRQAKQDRRFSAYFESFKGDAGNSAIISKIPVIQQFISKNLQGKELFAVAEQEMEDNLGKLSQRLDSGGKLYRRWKQDTNGKIRFLAVPCPELSLFFVNRLLPFVKSVDVHKCAHGGETGWSVKKSLGIHLPLKSVLSFDMKDAFNQIKAADVFGFFYRELARVSSNSNSDEEIFEVSASLSYLCTVRNTGEEYTLPQGSPISVALFNRILFALDHALEKISLESNFVYTRWVDDFIFSSKEKIQLECFSKIISIANSNIMLSEDKMFFQNNPCCLLGHRISGLTANLVPREERKKILSDCSIKFTHMLGDLNLQ